MVRERQHISHPAVLTTPKNAVIAVLLAGLLGPFGLFYATVSGAMIMIVVAIALAMFTWGIGVFLVWPLCMVWAWRATVSHNKKHFGSDAQHQGPAAGQ
jgi:membrane protein implicated in regulation of membrane protease activity